VARVANQRRLPRVAIVGRPNVGKSTLYNRLVGGRAALVHDRPGITRDLRYGTMTHGRRDIEVVDSGGLDPSLPRESERSLGAAIHRMAQRAIDEADLVVLVTDGEMGVTPADEDIARDLRKRGKRMLLVANKVDSARREGWETELYELGAEQVFGVSASHGRGVAELCDAIVEAVGGDGEATTAGESNEGLDDGIASLDGEGGDREGEGESKADKDGAEEADDRRVIRLAIVGKPNAGKSSLVNRLVGQERVVVHEQAGTTMDAVDTPLRVGGRDFLLVDTAGIRRQRSVDDSPERVAVQKALDSIGRCDVVVLAVDADEGPTEQDARIAGYAEEKGRACVIALTKWDLVSPASRPKPGIMDAEDSDPARRLRERLRDDLPHLSYAPIVVTSSQTGHGVDRLLGVVVKAFEQYRRRVPTGELNRFFEGVLAHHPPPSDKGRQAKLYYVTQASARPPTFVVQSNAPELVSYSYRRYLMNQIRERFGFEGTAIRLSCARRSRKK
jgi:GTP-binding protein